MSDEIYLSDWKHPQVVKWQQEDEAATAALRRETDEYRAEEESIQKGWNEIYAYRFGGEPRRPDGHVDTDKITRKREELDRRWAALAQHPYRESSARLAEALAQREDKRADEESVVLATVEALRTTDTALTTATDQTADKGHRYHTLKAEIEALTAALEQVTEEWVAAWREVEDVRETWDAHAAAAQYPGKPTADLPRRTLHQAHRYERSLLVGINATEADVSKRRTFEEALA